MLRQMASKDAPDHLTGRTGILVLGMHRSGTSALTRVLNLLGCDLPQHLLQASPNDNDLGFWESPKIVELDEKVLCSAGSGWDDWLPFNPSWFSSPKAVEFHQEAQRVLREEFSASSLFVVKDPRICRFAPLWLEAMQLEGIMPHIVIPIRNPLEVAASLNRRNKMDTAWACLMWLRYTLDSERDTRGKKRYFTSYDRLLKDWATLAADISESFSISWPRFSVQAEMQIGTFLSENYRHHRETENRISNNPLVSNWLKKAFAIFSRWSEQGELQDDHAELDHIRSELDSSTPAFARLVLSGREATRKVTALDATLNEIQSKLDKAEASDVHQSRRIQELEENLRAARDRSREERDKFDILIVDQQTLLDKIDLLEQHQEHALSTIASKDNEIASSADSLATARTELAELHATAQSLHTELDDLRGRLAHTQSALAQRSAEADDIATQLQYVKRRADDDLKIEQARLAKRLEEIVALTQMLHDKEAEIYDTQQRFRLETETIQCRLSQSESELATLRADKSTAEERVTERFNEIAHMTSLLGEAERTAGLSKEQVAWLREVSTVLLDRPGSRAKGRLAFLLPAPIRLAKQKKKLKRKGIFDPDAYLAANPDVAEAGMDPLSHYINHGISEGRRLR